MNKHDTYIAINHSAIHCLSWQYFPRRLKVKTSQAIHYLIEAVKALQADVTQSSDGHNTHLSDHLNSAHAELLAAKEHAQEEQ